MFNEENIRDFISRATFAGEIMEMDTNPVIREWGKNFHAEAKALLTKFPPAPVVVLEEPLKLGGSISGL